MIGYAVMVRHRVLPGRRDEVWEVWRRWMGPAVAENPGHLAYFYHFDEQDPDVIVAYQRYRDAEAAEAFLRTEAYASYTAEVEPLLAGPPVVTVLRTLWAKDA